MGWYFTNGGTRAELIRELIQGFTHEETGARREYVAHCTIGNVLWTVWEDIHPGSPPRRWIGCDLLEKNRDGWGHKPMCESVHPYYYSCPLKYLEMAPVASEAWREGVRQYWDNRRAQAAHRRRA